MSRLELEKIVLMFTASITYGLQSSNGNGYREDLRNLLAPIQVTYVGSQCSGSMSNGNSEGHPGFAISQMEAVATPDLEDKPNVVLVYVGTNDMKFGNADKAPSDMKKLISFLVDKLPNSLIVVSKLFLNTNPAVQKRIVAFNQQIPGLEKLGNVIIADMSSALSASDLSSDGTHPNDGGYAKMAKVFDAVLIQAEQQGKISSPEKTIKSFKICNSPVSDPLQTEAHTSTTSSSGSNSGKETPKPVKSQPTTTPTKIHSSDESSAQSELSSKSTIASKPKVSTDSVVPNAKSSAASLPPKPKSTTCDSKKGSTSAVAPLPIQSGKTVAPSSALSFSQSPPTKVTTSEKNSTTSGSKQSSFTESSVSSHTGASSARKNFLIPSQTDSPSTTPTSDSNGSSSLSSLGSEPTATGYPTNTADSNLVSPAPTPASNQASTSPLSSKESDAGHSTYALSASDDLGINVLSNSSAFGYSSASNASGSPNAVLSTGPRGTKTSLVGLMISALGLQVML